MELRQELCEQIIGEVTYIARASDGALNPDWVMKQPIFIRKKYLKQFQEEQKKLAQKNSTNK